MARLRFLADMHISPATIRDLSEGIVVSADETTVRYRFLPILGERD
jgi:hypothetical protein